MRAPVEAAVFACAVQHRNHDVARTVIDEGLVQRDGLPARGLNVQDAVVDQRQVVDVDIVGGVEQRHVRVGHVDLHYAVVHRARGRRLAELQLADFAQSLQLLRRVDHLAVAVLVVARKRHRARRRAALYAAARVCHEAYVLCRRGKGVALRRSHHAVAVAAFQPREEVVRALRHDFLNRVGRRVRDVYQFQIHSFALAAAALNGPAHRRRAHVLVHQTQVLYRVAVLLRGEAPGRTPHRDILAAVAAHPHIVGRVAAQAAQHVGARRGRVVHGRGGVDVVALRYAHRVAADGLALSSPAHRRSLVGHTAQRGCRRTVAAVVHVDNDVVDVQVVVTAIVRITIYGALAVEDYPHSLAGIVVQAERYITGYVADANVGEVVTHPVLRTPLGQRGQRRVRAVEDEDYKAVVGHVGAFGRVGTVIVGQRKVEREASVRLHRHLRRRYPVLAVCTVDVQREALRGHVRGLQRPSVCGALRRVDGEGVVVVEGFETQPALRGS